ncbi:hypothetical protein [Brachybacterium sp. UNK5269]|uniref:hypothetical protein n=1 Tax=Brachybacterium sp. UNK5269 TaxID=3408576 RepID=UPI003BB04867
MGAQDTAAPRITALPGPSSLVRISAGTWERLRAVVLGEAPAAAITAAQREELAGAGLLVEAPEPEGAPVLAPHWEQILRAALRSPVGIELVCVDGARGWTTRIRIAGRVVVVIDRAGEAVTEGGSVRLSRRSGAVLLGVTTLEHLSATFEQLVPQRPAFTAAEPTPAPSQEVDAPAVAEVQMLVVSAPSPGRTVVSGGSWYACGPRGEQLAVLMPAGSGARAAELAPGSLTSAMRAKVIAAIDHAGAA